MQFSNRSQLNNRDIEPGQTLFEYLKRKKQIALKQSVQTSLLKSNKNQIANQVLKQEKIQQKQKQQHKQQTTKRKVRKSSSKKRGHNPSNESHKQNNSKKSNLKHFQKSIIAQKGQKPKNQPITQRTTQNPIYNKDLKQQQYEYMPKKTNRSFISMISPLKSKDRSVSYSKINQNVTTFQRNIKDKRQSQNFSKKIIHQTLGKVQDTFLQQINFQKHIKQKIRSFLIHLSSVLLQIQQNQEVFYNLSGFQKKVKLLRSNIKLINSFLSNHQKSNNPISQQIIENFHTILNQNINKLQSQLRTQNLESNDSQLYQLKQNYQTQIEQLNKQKTRLSRQINIGNKKMQKMQNQYNKILQKFNNLQDYVQKFQNQQQNQEKSITVQFGEQLSKLNEQKMQLKNQNKQLISRLKDSEYRFQQVLRKETLQNQQKLSDRESFLLKQIQILKQQCSKDISNLNNIHTHRQQKLLVQIGLLNESINEKEKNIIELEGALKISKEYTLTKDVQYKGMGNKVQEAVYDLYRMNQQLYRHWLALKDIKTLLIRLNNYDKFQPIYKDLKFDQKMFLN